MTQEKYAIRFGLGGIKAVGLGMMEAAVAERKSAGKFKDVHDFAIRMDAKAINKKLIEALAKSGSLDSIADNRRQIFESFEMIAATANQKKDEASSNQMSMFGELLDEANSKPELKRVTEWTKEERLQKEFDAFGFFLNEHPLDDHLLELKKRGVVFSDKIEKDELQDSNLIKMAGVIAGSKHRSGPRGRFAYMTISDPLGIFEAMIFDEAIITNARDILVDGSQVVIECLIKKDDGGVRILIRDVQKLVDFIKNVKAAKEPFEDIKKQPQLRFGGGWGYNKGGENNYNNGGENSSSNNFAKATPAVDHYKQKLEKLEAKKIFSEVQIFVKERDPILTAKTVLSQLLAPASFAKKTKVIFVVEMGDKKANVALPENYLLDEADLARLRAIDKVIEVRAN